MKLPPDSLIATEKLTHYLLVRQEVSDKSAFLARGGYTLENAERLMHDLRSQVLDQEAVRLESNFYGQLYVIRTDLTGPSGRVLRVRTIWMTEHLSGITKFITLIPEKE